jgi:hypothetical protein
MKHGEVADHANSYRSTADKIKYENIVDPPLSEDGIK